MPFQGVKTKNSKGVMISRAIHMFGGGYKRQKDDTASLSSSSDAVATSTTINSVSTNQEAVSHTTSKKYDSLPPWESPEQKTTAYYGVQDDKRQESPTSSSSSPRPALLLFEAYNGDCDTTMSSSRRQNGNGAAASSSNRRDAVTVNETSRWRHDTSKDSLPLLDHDHRSSNINNNTDKSNISRTILNDPFQNNNTTEIGPTSTSNIHLLLLDEEDTDHTIANSHNNQQQEETQATDHPEDALFDELVSARGRDALLLLHNTPGGGVLETRDPHPSHAAVTTPTQTRASIVRVFQEEKPPPSLFPLDAEESRTSTLQSTEPRYLNNNDNNNQRRQDPPSSRGLPSPPRDPQGSFFSSLPASAPVVQLPKDPSADSALLVETSSSRLLLNNSNSDVVVGNGAAASSPSRCGTGPESNVCRTPPPRSQQQQYISQSPVSSLIRQFEASHSPKHHHQQQQHLKLTWKNGKEVAPDNSTGGTSSSRSCMPAPTTSKVDNNTIGSSHLKITWQNGKEVVPDATSGGGSSCTRITNTSHHVRRASAGDGNQKSFLRLQRRDSEPVVLEHQHHHNSHQKTQQTAGRGAEKETSPSRRYKMFPRTSPMNNCNSSSSTRDAGGQHPSFLRDKTPLTTSTSFQTAAKLYSMSSDSVAANRGVDCTATKPCDTDDFDILAAQRGATKDDFTKSAIDGDTKSMIAAKKDNIGKTTIDNCGVKNISTTTICTNDDGQPKNECQQQSHDDFDLLVAQRGSWNNNAESPAAGKHIGGIGNSSSYRACRTSNVQLAETRIRRNSDDFDMLAARATTLKLSDIPAFRDSTKNYYMDDIWATPKPRHNSNDFDMLAARAATLNLPDIPAFCDTKITQSTKNDDTDNIQATAKPRCNSDDFDLLAARSTTKLPDIPAWRDEDKITQAKARWNTDEFNMLASSRATLSNFLPQTADVEKSDQPTRRILQRSKSSSTEWNYRSLDLRGDQEDSLKDQVTENSNERPLWARQYGPRKRVLNTEDPNELTYWVIDPMTGLCYLEISVEGSTPRGVEEFLAQEVDLEVDGDDRLQLSSKIWSQVNHASSTAMEASSAFARSCVTPKSKKTSNRGRRKIRPSLSFRAGSTKSRLTRSFSFNSVR